MTANDLRRARPSLPLPSFLVLAVLFTGPVLTHEAVFGSWVGLTAAGAGVVVGLLIAAASTRWSWDTLSTLAAVLLGYFLVGGPVALPATVCWRVVPTTDTLLTLVRGAVSSWKDLLTLTPPASSYVGPALVPWITGLLCALGAGLVSVRWGRPLLGILPVALMGIVGLAFGPSGLVPPVWPFMVWCAGAFLWLTWASAHQRLSLGLDVSVNRRGHGEASASTVSARGASRQAVFRSRRLLAASLMIVLAVGVALPVTDAWGPSGRRIVARELVEPPFNVRQYPSPLSAFRHYKKDLGEQTVMTVSGLPARTRIRLAALDVYDGTTFTMSAPKSQISVLTAATEDGKTQSVNVRNGYVAVGSTIPRTPSGLSDGEFTATIETAGILGPWVPVAGDVREVTFGGENARTQQEGLRFDMWANAALTTGIPAQPQAVTVRADAPVVPTDSQFAGATPMKFHSDTKEPYPSGLDSFMASIVGSSSTPIEKARAIERYLHNEGFYLTENTDQSRPGHNLNRLSSMVSGTGELIGDDEQYAALMALMLHQLGWNARVVIGAYPEGEPTESMTLLGSDMHVWVEMEFEGIGWAVFDPTPDKDRVPESESHTKKNSPRPQVLQPPEPPEEPVELPPVSRDQDVAAKEPPPAGVPWLLIGTTAGSLILLILPFVLIVALKARRTRVRRKASPGVALVGSWDEVVDMALDAGVRVRADQTRQETAWALASFWKLREGQDAESAGDRPEGAQASGSDLIPGWTMFRESVPMTVAIARRADVADFAAEAGQRAEAESAWADVDHLKRSLASSASLWVRLRRRFSLRSLARKWRLKPTGSQERRGPAELLDDGEDAGGPQWRPSSVRSKS